jgi:hypothetical protein
MHFIGIERSEPPFPGMAVEEQPEEIGGEPGKLEILRLNVVHNRFPGRVFYLFLLDTCEEIHEESWKTFQRLIDGARLD